MTNPETTGLKKKRTKRLTVSNLKVILDNMPDEGKVQFYNERIIVIDQKGSPSYYNIFNNGRVKTT